MLRAIEGLWLAAALRTSFIAYPLVNALHVLSLGVLVTTVGLMDLRVLGRFSAFDGHSFIAALRPLAYGAFAGTAATGFALFSIRASEYAFNPAFQLKLALIVVAGLNLALFQRAGRGRAMALRGGFSVTERVTAAASLILWPGVLAAGRFVGFV